MKRRGFTLLEAMVAAVLMAVAATICLQMLLLSSEAQRAADRRRLATRELANIMERLMACPQDQLTPEAIQNVRVSKDVAESLPDARVDVRLDAAEDGPSGTRITLVLGWQGRGKQPARPVRLVAWRYAPQEVTP